MRSPRLAVVCGRAEEAECSFGADERRREAAETDGAWSGDGGRGRAAADERNGDEESRVIDDVRPDRLLKVPREGDGVREKV